MKVAVLGEGAFIKVSSLKWNHEVKKITCNWFAYTGNQDTQNTSKDYGRVGDAERRWLTTSHRAMRGTSPNLALTWQQACQPVGL